MIESAVIATEISKVAGFKLPKDISEWNDKIIGQFFTEIDFIPKEYAVDIVVTNMDENTGYAKGSIVVSNGMKQINFPVIVAEYDLSPFDVFASKEDGNIKYRAATKNNVSKALHTDIVGVEQDLPKGYSSQDTKSPGGVQPKMSVSSSNMDAAGSGGDGYVTFDKAASQKFDWKSTVSDEQFNKFAGQVIKNPDIISQYFSSTGDTITGIIDEVRTKRKVVTGHRIMGIDSSNLIKTKQVQTILDSDMFDVSMLRPVRAPSVCDIKLTYQKTMEDAIESGDSAVSRYTALTNGTTIRGVVIKEIDVSRRGITPCSSEKFISLDGNYFYDLNYYNGKPGLYGIESADAAASDVGAAVSLIGKSATSSIHNPAAYTKARDKQFVINQDSNDAYNHYSSRVNKGNVETKLLVIFGAIGAFECFTVTDSFTRKMVNDNYLYVGEDFAIVPASVAYPTLVKDVKDPLYKSVIGKASTIVLVPEICTTILNTEFMTRINRDSIMEPDTSLVDIAEKVTDKVALQVYGDGYTVIGNVVNDLYKVAGIQAGSILSSKDTSTVLRTIGMSKEASYKAMFAAMNNYNEGAGPVSIFGVHSNYINADETSKVASSESYTRQSAMLKEYADEIRVDLFKVASLLDDPEAVDVVLSLNFVNEDNVKDYMNYVDEFREVSDKLASMLVASRMGLKTIDESSVCKAIDGLEGAIDDLNNLKFTFRSDA